LAATLIGIDVGTTSIKATLIDMAGVAVDSFSQPYPTARPRPGHVEQSPDDWMSAVLVALTGFAQAHDLSGLAGIGLCSQVNTHVFVDSAGKALLPAMVWQDGRCAEDAAAIDGQVSNEQKMAWFGAPMPIDASHALSRMAHVARTAPDHYAATRHVMLPKDYCALQLTGVAASDAISAIGLVTGDLAYIDDLIALVPNARAKLPPLIRFTDMVGRVRDGLPCSGTPVFTGTMDAWSAMLGVGVVEDGEAMYLSGTSEVPGIISERITPTPGVILFPRYEGITLHAAPTQSGGASLLWISELLGRAPEDILALAGQTPRSASVPLFLPHLQGERAPLWDIKSRGTFARLDGATGPGEMSRSVLEGVAFSARLAFKALEKSAAPADMIHIGGGGARSDIWCQIRADALGKALRRAAVSDAGTLGAAIIAGVGAGEFASLKEASSRLTHYDRTFEPDPAQRDYYDDKYGRYLELYEDLKDFNQRYV
jgi:xylulokinase